MFFNRCYELYNQILPQLYDASLSFDEMIYALKKAVKLLADENKKTQDQVEAFVKEFTKILDDMNARLDAETKKNVYELLNKWKDDGYFDEILRESLQVPINQELPYKRLFRLLFETGRNSTFFGKNNESLENFGDYYALMQGNLFYKDANGVKKVACAMIPYGTEDTPFYTNNARLSIYDRAGTKVNTAIFPIEHANGIAYHNGKLYVNGCYYYENSSADSSTGSGKVFVINESNLSLIETVEFPLVIQNIFVMNDEFYANEASDSTGFSKIYKLDFENKTATEYLSLSPKIENPTQSLYYANGNIYVATPSPFNGVSVYNARTGKLITRYALPQYGRDYTYIGEVQGCTYEDGKLLIGGSFNLGESLSQVRCNAFFEADPWRGLDINDAPRPTNGQVLIVDPDNKGLKHIMNPDGSRARPFKMIAEASYYVNAHPSHDFTIQLIGNTEYMAQFRTSKSVTIETPAAGGTTANSKWTGNLLLEGGIFTLHYLKIGQTIPALNTDGYCASINQGVLSCAGIDFHAASSSEEYGKAAYGLYCQHSFVNFCPTNYTNQEQWKALYPNGDTMCINAGHTSFINMSANNSE